MASAVLTLSLRTQEDVLLTRRRARDLAALLQFPPEEQIGLSTAVWEIARLASEEGEAELAIVEEPAVAVRVTVTGVPTSALKARGAIDMEGLRRLVDEVDATSSANGRATVCLSRAVDADAWLPDVRELELVLRSLTRHESGELEIVDELRQQNFELLTALATLREREAELTRLNADLGDTNSAVTALFGELERQAAEQRERADAHARFMRELTHELRTPLYAVRGMTESILRDRDEALDEGLRSDVELIDGAMVEALDLVNDHLDLAKLDAGQTIVRLSDVDVAEILATLRAVVTRLPSHDGVELRIAEGRGLPTLHTDAFKLSQILRNLVVNALKFTERGEVCVWADAAGPDPGVTFAVKDTGPGMSPEDVEQAFQAFAQLGVERRGVIRGTGLGLPITRQLTTLLGGELGIESELGRGSTFTVTIPAHFPQRPGVVPNARIREA
jgi:signal transduction histidine kinase